MTTQILRSVGVCRRRRLVCTERWSVGTDDFSSRTWDFLNAYVLAVRMTDNGKQEFLRFLIDLKFYFCKFLNLEPGRKSNKILYHFIFVQNNALNLMVLCRHLKTAQIIVT